MATCAVAAVGGPAAPRCTPPNTALSCNVAGVCPAAGDLIWFCRFRAVWAMALHLCFPSSVHSYDDVDSSEVRTHHRVQRAPTYATSPSAKDLLCPSSARLVCVDGDDCWNDPSKAETLQSSIRDSPLASRVSRFCPASIDSASSHIAIRL